MIELPKKAESAVHILVSSTAEMEVEEEHEAATDVPRPYKVTLVAAGLAASDMEVVAEQCGVLRVKGETARTGASIARSFQLPRDADAQRATASHVDGILTLTVPKKSEQVKRALKVSVGHATAVADDGEKAKQEEPAGKDEEGEEGVMV